MWILYRCKGTITIKIMHSIKKEGWFRCQKVHFCLQCTTSVAFPLLLALVCKSENRENKNKDATWAWCPIQVIYPYFVAITCVINLIESCIVAHCIALTSISCTNKCFTQSPQQYQPLFLRCILDYKGFV